MDDRNDFDRDMDDYITGRTRSSFFSFLKKKDESLPTEQPMSQPEATEPVRKESWFKSLFKSEAPSEEPNEPEEFKRDMKEIVRISLEAVKLLPKEQLDQYKSSQHFTRLKELLKKHQFIK